MEQTLKEIAEYLNGIDDLNAWLGDESGADASLIMRLQVLGEEDETADVMFQCIMDNDAGSLRHWVKEVLTNQEEKIMMNATFLIDDVNRIKAMVKETGKELHGDVSYTELVPGKIYVLTADTLTIMQIIGVLADFGEDVFYEASLA